MGKRDLAKEPKMRFAGAAALIAVALSVIFIGSPSTEQKYTQLAPVKDTALAKREVQIVPAELFHTMYDNKLQLVILDIRSEADYNLFHLRGAQRAAQRSERHRAGTSCQCRAQQSCGRDEQRRSRRDYGVEDSVAEAIPNVYILEGGVNNWLAFFGKEDKTITPIKATVTESLQYKFTSALEIVISPLRQV